MRHIKFILLAIVCLVTVAVIGSAFLSADEKSHRSVGQQKKGPPRPVVNTHELMELFNEPLYNELARAIQSEPTEKKGWGEIEKLGMRGAEIINLVAIRESTEDHLATWQQLSKEAQEAAMQIAHAAKSQDWEATMTACRELVKNCNDCHQAIAPDHAPKLDLPGEK